MCSSSIFSNTCRHPTVTTKQHSSSTNVDNGNTIRWSGVRPSPVCVRRHGTGSLGHRVNGSFGSSFTSGSPGYHFDPVRDPRGFSRFSKKMPKKQNVHLKCRNDKSHCQVSVVGLKLLDVSPCNELLHLPMIIKNSLAWEYFFTHRPQSTFGVHYRRGSPGQLGLRVAGFPGHWVTKCDPVPFLVCVLIMLDMLRSVVQST